MWGRPALPAAPYAPTAALLEPLPGRKPCAQPARMAAQWAPPLVLASAAGLALLLSHTPAAPSQLHPPRPAPLAPMALRPPVPRLHPRSAVDKAATLADEGPSPNYDAMTIAELKRLLKERNLSAAMLREDFVERLRRADGEGGAAGPSPSSTLQATLEAKEGTLAQLQRTRADDTVVMRVSERRSMEDTIGELQAEVAQLRAALERAEAEAEERSRAIVLLKADAAEVAALRAQLQTARAVQGGGMAVAALTGGTVVLFFWVPVTAVLMVLAAAPVGAVCLAVGLGVGFAGRLIIGEDGQSEGLEF